jgi:hypothetical protein
LIILKGGLIVKNKHRPVVYKTKKGWRRAKKSRLFPKPVTLTGGKKMPGLPKRFAKMGFKKGWAAFKRTIHGGGEMSGHRKKSRKVHHALWLNGDISTPALVRSPVKRLSSITPQKIFAPVIDLALLIAGMAAGAGIKRMVPIKNPHLMNGTQTIIGVGGSLMTKNRFVKMPLLGIALQSTISETKLLLPKIPLAGDDEVMYLEDMSGEDYPQIEYMGQDDRMAEEIPVEIVEGDESFRGDEEEMYGESGEGGE